MRGPGRSQTAGNIQKKLEGLRPHSHGSFTQRERCDHMLRSLPTEGVIFKLMTCGFRIDLLLWCSSVVRFAKSRLHLACRIGCSKARTALMRLSDSCLRADVVPWYASEPEPYNLNLKPSTRCVCRYVCLSLSIYIYIYIYIEKVCVYIYIHTYTMRIWDITTGLQGPNIWKLD